MSAEATLALKTNDTNKFTEFLALKKDNLPDLKVKSIILVIISFYWELWCMLVILATLVGHLIIIWIGLSLSAKNSIIKFCFIFK